MNEFGAPRALADLLGGYDGGWAFWSAMLSAVEQAVQRSRAGDGRFSSWPSGEFDRFVADLDDALGLGVIGVTVQQLVNDGDTDGRQEQRRQFVADVLLDRARDARDARIWGAAGKPAGIK